MSSAFFRKRSEKCAAISLPSLADLNSRGLRHSIPIHQLVSLQHARCAMDQAWGNAPVDTFLNDHLGVFVQGPKVGKQIEERQLGLSKAVVLHESNPHALAVGSPDREVD